MSFLNMKMTHLIIATYYLVYRSKAQFSKAKWLRDMEAQDRLFSWVSASDGLEVPVGGSSHSERPSCSPQGF